MRNVEPFDGNDHPKEIYSLQERRRSSLETEGSSRDIMGLRNVLPDLNPLRNSMAILLSSSIGFGCIHGETMPIKFPIDANQFLQHALTALGIHGSFVPILTRTEIKG